MMVVKALLTAPRLPQALKAARSPPLLFIGGTLGLALFKILTFIPQGVAVTAEMAGVACAAFPLPLTVAHILGLLGGQPDLLPGIVIGAVVGFLVSKAITPLLPKPRSQSPGNEQRKWQVS